MDAPSGLRLTATSPPATLQAGRLTLRGVLPDGGPPLAAGQTREQDGVRLLALPSEPTNASGDTDTSGDTHTHTHTGVGAGVILVVGFGGRTVLWAPTPGSLGASTLEVLDGARLDAAALALPTPDPLPVAHLVARLRRHAALAPDADLVALPAPGPAPTGSALRRLRARLAQWDLRIAEPGGLLAIPSGSPERAMRTLVLGAAASGKSAAAEDLLAAEPDVVYAATGPVPGPEDLDWARRVERHQQRRPPWWRTTAGAGLAELLATPGPPVLVDSLGTWVTAALTAAGAWDDVPGWSQRYEQEVDQVVRAWRTGARRVVAVGEETGWGVVPGTVSGRRFRDALGSLTRRLADHSERVLLVVAGRVVDLDALDPWGAGR